MSNITQLNDSSANSDLENMFETLNTKGWDLLVEGFATQFEGCNQVIGCSNEKDMAVRQGQLIILQQLLTLREDVKEQMQESYEGVDLDADL